MMRRWNLFQLLAWSMMGLGLLMGLVFPWFSLAMGVPRPLALSGEFILACTLAGIIVGGLNFALTKHVVSPRLRQLIEGMHSVSDGMKQATYTGNWGDCDVLSAHLPAQTQDDLGALARSYNTLLDALCASYQMHDVVKVFTRILSSKLDMDEMAQQALQLLLTNCHCDGGALLIQHRDGWQTAAAIRLSNPAALTETATFQTLIREQKIHCIHLPKDGIFLDGILAQFVPADVMLAPIIHHEVVLGWVVLASQKDLGVESSRMLASLVNPLGMALNNAVLYADLQSQVRSFL